MTVLYAFLIIAVLGAALGFGLAVAEKKLSVEKDEKLVQIEEIMPGANCGGCGFAGCSAYAEAVATGAAQPGLCSPGGQALADKMAQIMGLESASIEKKVAFVFCKGNCDQSKKDFKYYGVSDCNAAAMLFGGDNLCKEGCLHLGSCINVCSQNAISKDNEGNVVVNPDKCIGCGKCTKVCPKGVIRLIPASEQFAVACSSHKKGPEVKAQCDKGCIGCKICEVKFPESGIKVDNFLASVTFGSNQAKREEASLACPRKIIVKVK